MDLVNILKLLKNQNSQFIGLYSMLEAESNKLKHDIERRRRNIQMYRRQINNLGLFSASMTKIWKLNGASTFWEKDVPRFTEKKFKENFRVSRKSFDLLVKKVIHLRRNNTKFRMSIPISKRVAIALYALGSSAEIRTIAALFGVGRTTTGEILREFSEEIWNVLKKDYLNTYPPTHAKMEEILNGFNSLGFPQCFGAIDSCHIEVQPHKDAIIDYYNSKGWYSIILMAVVDYRCRFSYIGVGAPGRNTDLNVFEKSYLKEHHETNPIFKEYTQIIDSVKIPVVLLGDAAFKLSNILLKPYPEEENQTESHSVFNYEFWKCRRVVEMAFEQMKARFGRLRKPLENSIDNIPIIIKACCILHNFCIEENDPICNNWLQEVEKGKCTGRQQPHQSTTLGDDDLSSIRIRDTLAQYFLHRPAEAAELEQTDSPMESEPDIKEDDITVQNITDSSLDLNEIEPKTIVLKKLIRKKH